MRKLIFLICFISLLISCDKNFRIEELYPFKNKFDKNFTDHFPKKLTCSFYSIDSDTNPKHNNVGLYLYQKIAEKKNLEEVKLYADKKAIAKYSSIDKCLLIVNRFETDSTYKYNVEPKIDTLKLGKPCEKNLYPIPNFINYESKNLYNDLRLDDSFIIYVFEAKRQMLKKYTMNASAQMPIDWKNGYSKGIAISDKNKEVIYWSVAW